MAETFKNEQVKPLKTNDLEGTVTIPIILTDDDLATYVEVSRELDKAIEEGKLTMHTQVRHDITKHIVRAVDFPGVTLKQFRNGKRPFPAVMVQVYAHIQPLLADALHLKNS